MKVSLETARLEQIYERALQQSERIYEQGRCRVIRVENLLLQDDNDTLHEQLAESDQQIESLETEQGEIVRGFTEATEELHYAQNGLRVNARDIENYKAELHALSSVSADSTKLLTEKLALTRELSSLKPEMEHLRSQAATHQSALAEKLSLQRELTSVQVELETERRALQRTKAKDSKATQDDAKALSQLEDLRKELAKEKREAQNRDREARKKGTEWEGQKTILESKLDAFRNKLRSTKEQLKETQKDLETAQKAARNMESAQARPAPNPRKRSIARFDPDMTIGTPGDRPAAKRNKNSSTLPGDKSAFSITPFLNRTSTFIAPDSPEESEAETSAQPTEQQPTVTLPVTISTAPSEAPSPTQTQTQTIPLKKAKEPASKKTSTNRVLKETTAPRANLLSSFASRKSGNSTKSVSLPRVAEESDEENQPTNRSNPVLKKKQKILGTQRKSLFDDDEEEPPARARAVRTLGIRGGGGPLISLAAKPRSLAEFSPLKKDRNVAAEGVQAS